MSTQTEEFRRERPAPLAPRPLNLPAPSEATLANGLRVVVVEAGRVPLVSFRLALRAGDALDPPEMPGLMDILTSMLTEGTEGRTSRQIADEVARLGATLSAGASSDYTTVAASVLSAYTDEMLELLADVALRPSFPEDELALTKLNSQQNLIAQRAQASFLASETLARVVFGEHPYSIVAPTHESIEAMTRERMLEFHRSQFVPNNAVLFVVGDVERERLLRRVEELFGGWARGEATEPRFADLPPRTRRTAHIIDRPGSAQSNIVIANPAIRRTDPDYFPLLVMHTVLGATASSRLFMNLREEKGYTYGAYTTLDARRFAGTFRASAEVRSPVTGASLTEFFRELERIRDEDVSDKELADAKSYLTGIFPVRLETQEGLIDQLVQLKMHDLPEDYLETYRERVTRVTGEDVRRVANRHVLPDLAAVVVVGDASAIAEQVRPFAEDVEFFDSAGQRKTGGQPPGAPGGAAAEKGEAAAGDSETDEGGETVMGLEGTWDLEVATPFGKHPATLVVERAGGGDGLGGRVDSQLGSIPLDTLSLSGDDFSAGVSHEFRGQTYTAQVTGRVAGDRLEGTIKVNLPIAPPVRFTGTRAV